MKKRYRLNGEVEDGARMRDAQILLPTLQAFVDAGGELRTRDLYNEVAVRVSSVASVDPNVFEKRARWGQQILKIEKMITPPTKRGGKWTITESGRRFAASGVLTMVVPFYVTPDGFALCGDVIEALAYIENGSTNAIWTSPPFPTRKDVRKYGTMNSTVWREWMLRVMSAAVPKLTQDGSMFIHLGQTWRERLPAVDTYIERFAIALEDDLGMHILQRLYRINECALPGPIEWTCKTRERLKTSVEIIYWVSMNPHPKATTNHILVPYAKGSDRAFEQPAVAARRDSGMDFSATSFRRRSEGAIPPTHIVANGSSEHNAYRKACRAAGLRPHPCPAQRAIVETPLKIVTRPGDVVGDIFYGSGYTGAVARSLDCSHWGIDRSPEFLEGAMTRFPDAKRLYPISKTQILQATR